MVRTRLSIAAPCLIAYRGPRPLQGWRSRRNAPAGRRRQRGTTRGGGLPSLYEEASGLLLSGRLRDAPASAEDLFRSGGQSLEVVTVSSPEDLLTGVSRTHLIRVMVTRTPHGPSILVGE